MNEHPCDGPWLVLDALVARCTVEALAEGLGRAADWGLTGLMGSPAALELLPIEVSEALGIMEVRGPDPGEQRTLHGSAPEPDLIAWPPGPRHGPGYSQEAGPVLDLRFAAPCSAAGDLEQALRAPPSEFTAVLLGEVDEECLDAVSRADDLAAFVPGDEFASGYRLGASSHFGALAALHPWAAARASEIAEENVGLALGLERRLQRFLEVELAPRMRRLRLAPKDRDILLVEIFDWLPASSPQINKDDARGLAERLRDGMPELFSDAP